MAEERFEKDDGEIRTVQEWEGEGERDGWRGDTLHSPEQTLRHHEYLIIMSGVTSVSPPSDSARAEFHR